MNPYVVWTEEEAPAYLVGNKASNLIKLQLAGFLVPSFFCVTTNAYEDFIKFSKVQMLLERLEDDLGSQDLTTLTMAANKVRQAILMEPIPDPISESIELAIEQLDTRAPLVARSSATVEDTPEYSFAGLYRTFLNLDSRSKILDGVKGCWASLWSAESVFSRYQLGVKIEQASMSVIIQSLIDSTISGVVFTRSPFLSQSDHLVINAAWGLGEGVVSGSVAADMYTLDREGLAVATQVIAEKEHSIVTDDTSGTKRVITDPSQAEQPALNTSQLAEISSTALRIEKLFDSAQDIEWCYSDNQLYILQSRPITGVKEEDSNEVVEGIYQAMSDEDHEAFWRLSGNLGRTPLTPFAKSVWSTSALASEKVSEILALPSISTWKVFNDYIYVGARPLPMENQESTESRDKRHRVLCNDFVHKWESEHKEEIQKNNAYLENLNLIEASLTELVDYLKHALEIWGHHWEIHDLSLKSKHYMVTDFLATMKGLFGQGKWQTFLSLLQGFENDDLSNKRELWKITEQIKGNEKVMQCLQAPSIGEIFDCLRAIPEAAPILNAINHFLQRWGNRIIGPNDLMHPSWREDPSFLFETLESYIKTEQPDPLKELSRLEQKRKESEEWLWSELSGNYEIQQEVFRKLQLAQTWVTFLEDHNYLIEQTLVANLRRIALTIGRRLQSTGSISLPEDVFFIPKDQIETSVKLATLPKFQSLVKKNRAAYQTRMDVLIPHTLGALPTREPDLDKKTSQRTDEHDYLSMFLYPDPTRELPARLIGIPAAPGYAKGPARIIREIDEYSKVKPGEILVCHRTTPQWTPLFAIISGIVANSGGGVLQHTAITARESGIPAVIGTQVATEVIQSGQIVTVDGTNGIVELYHG